MTILTSTSAAVALRHTPAWLKDADNPPVYLLRAGSVQERELLEAELAGEYQAGPVWGQEVLDAVFAGFRALGGDDTETLIALAEADAANALESESEKATLRDAMAVLAQYWPDYRRLVAQMERRKALVPLAAFRRFCCGWENVDAVFERGPDRCLTDAALQGIDPLHLKDAGIRAYQLLRAGGAEKNSAAPSKSGADLEISTSDGSSRADGELPETSGSKTPA